MKSIFKRFFLVLVTITGIYLTLLVNLPVFFTAVLFLVYLITLGQLAKKVLIKVFGFSAVFRTKVFGVFLVFIVLGYVGGLFVLFTVLSVLNLSLILFLTALLFFACLGLTKKTKLVKKDNLKDKQEIVIQSAPKARGWVLIYLILVSIGFYLLVSSKSGAVIFSPWQAINTNFVFVFLLATVILGMVLFSKISRKSLLFLLILHSFLLHGYLPLTHTTLYGADQWRHLAVEKRLLAQQPADIVLHDQNPQNIIQKLNPGKLTYNNLWASEVILARFTGIGLLNINKWIIPALFALLFPLLLYELGKIFWRQKTKALLLAWASFIVFPIQFLGAISLPVSFGLLSYLLFIILILKRIQKPKKQQLVFLGLFWPLSVFGYSLYFILSFVSWLLVEIIKLLKNKPSYSFVLILPGVLLLPTIELITKYSLVGESFNFFKSFKQFVGNMSGFYLASGPRIHDILGGNIIFNQVPQWAFVSNFLLYWRWWLLVFVVGLCLLVVYGLFILIKKQKLVYSWLAVMFVSLWGGYFIGFYVLEGLRPFSRRLDMILGVLLITVLMFAVNKIVFANKEKVLRRGLIFVCIFSLGITASFTLGPDTKTVSVDQLAAVEYIWFNSKDNHCVIAETYPLLAMEYVSAGKIVGGGFPIEHDFSQQQRQDLLKQINEEPSEEIWQQALKLTGAKKCWFIDEGVEDKNSSFFNNENIVNTRLFHNLIVWRYDEK